MYTMINIKQCFFILLININLNPICWYAFIPQILLHKLACLVRRGVINVHHVVVCVVLHENGVQVAEIQLRFYVVIRGYKQTKTQLIRTITAQVIKLFVVCFLLFHDFLDRLTLGLFILVEGSQFDCNLSLKVYVMHKLSANYCF